MPFRSFGLHEQLVRATHDLGYTEATPVQAGAIPAAVSGRDVLATAQTGTGKTAAFVLPMLHRLLESTRGQAARALVLSPTRELASQTESCFRSLARHTNLRSTVVVGGQPFFPQIRALRGVLDVIVATPGRLLDHVQKAPDRFEGVTTLALDEADTMLDMGFLPDIERIVAKLPALAQTLLFSATMPPGIAKLTKKLQRDPVRVQIGKATNAAVSVAQSAYPVPPHLKPALLRHLLSNTTMKSVLIFTRTKSQAERLAKLVAKDGFSVDELHSDRSPAQRARAMEGFRRGQCQVLVATNIAARGLDVNNITHVISIDVPEAPDDYVHRIGRTGRAGTTGEAYQFVSKDEERHLAQIERQVGQRIARVTLPNFDYKQAPPELPAGSGAPQRPGSRGHVRSGRR